MTAWMQRLQAEAAMFGTVLGAVILGAAFFVLVMMPFVFPIASIAAAGAIAFVRRRRRGGRPVGAVAGSEARPRGALLTQPARPAPGA